MSPAPQAYNPYGFHLGSSSSGGGSGSSAAGGGSSSGSGNSNTGSGLALRRLPLDTLSHEAPAPLGPSGAAEASGGGAEGAGSVALGPRLIRFDHIAYTDPLTRVSGGTPDTQGTDLTYRCYCCHLGRCPDMVWLCRLPANLSAFA